MNDNFTFEGFEPANTVPVPDVLFDVLLPRLNEAQLKVMLYIIRRTLGFKKTSDAISLKQFRHGITKKKGEKLDEGCGLKNMTTIIKALNDLEEMGCIESKKDWTEEHDKATTVYSIHFKGTTQSVVPTTQSVVPTTANVGRGTAQNVGRGTAQNVGRVLRKTESQETVLQETVLQEESVSDPTSETPAHEDTHTSFINSSSSSSPEEQVAETTAPTPQTRSSAETATSRAHTAPRTPDSPPPTGVRGVFLKDANRVEPPVVEDKAQVNPSKKPGWESLLDYWDSQYGASPRPKWVVDEAKDLMKRMKPTREQVDKVCAELKAREKPVTFENMYNHWHLLKEVQEREQAKNTRQPRASVSGRKRIEETDPGYAEYLAMMTEGGK